MEEDDIVVGWVECICVVSVDGWLLWICGGGIKDWYGQVFEGEIFDMCVFQGVVLYDLVEFVVMVCVGMLFVQFEIVFVECGQMLLFELLYFGCVVIVGGCVVVGFVGLCCVICGVLCDFVFGIMLMNGCGEMLCFGGQVVKNVVGYDVLWLMVGVFGMFGLMFDLLIKVLLMFVVEVMLKFEMIVIDVVCKFNEWGGYLLLVSVSVWCNGMFVLCLLGVEVVVKFVKMLFGGEVVDVVEVECFWFGLCEYIDLFFNGILFGYVLWCLLLLLIIELMYLLGIQLMEWGGVQCWWIIDVDV